MKVRDEYRDRKATALAAAETRHIYPSLIEFVAISLREANPNLIARIRGDFDQHIRASAEQLLNGMNIQSWRLVEHILRHQKIGLLEASACRLDRACHAAPIGAGAGLTLIGAWASTTGIHFPLRIIEGAFSLVGVSLAATLALFVLRTATRAKLELLLLEYES